MAIINVTPDSFSDGGRYDEPQMAIDRALKAIDEGADILDIGGESTRPYADSVDVSTELRRVMPVIEGILDHTDSIISIDTSKSKVAAEATAAGAQIINDVTGLEGDPDMETVACESGAGVCAMHMQGSVKTMQDKPTYENVVEDILSYLKRRKSNLIEKGIAAEKICLDPGIGFGKTHEHNLILLRHCHRFHEIGSPILVGHSRKGFIGKLLGNKEVERDSASAGIMLSLARQGIQVIRLHEIARAKRALLAFAESGGLD